MVTTVVVIIYSFPIEYAEFSCSTHTTQFRWWCTFHNAGARTIKSVFHSSAPGNVSLDAIVSKYCHIIYDETSDHKHTYMLCGSAHHTTQGDWDRVVCSNLVFSEMLKSHPPIAKQKGFRRHAILRKTSSRWLLCSAFVQSTCPSSYPSHLQKYAHRSHHLILLFMQIFAYLIAKVFISHSISFTTTPHPPSLPIPRITTFCIK